MLHPTPDRAEQDPDAWWQAIVVAVRQVIATSPDGVAGLSAISFSGQMHGTVLLDRANKVLGPAIIWPDQRSRRQVEEITELLGLARLVKLTGSPVATGFQAATLRWLQQEQPDLWRQVGQVLLPKDYLRWRLTGTFATDPSDGSGALLLDVTRRDWSPDLLAVLNIDPALLPPVQPSTAVVGPLTPAAATELGLPAGVLVVTGAADTACGLLGAGIVTDQTLLLSLSTGGQLSLPTQTVQVDPAGRLHTFCGALSPTPTQPGWYQMAAILSAGLALRWLRDNVFGLTRPDAYAQMGRWAAEAPPGANGLLFLPYLVGERTPHMDPQARGLFLGLRAAHGRAELVRAVMEGVALACYDSFSVLTTVGAAPTWMVMAGGGGQNSLWRQIMADIFNLPIQPLDLSDQSALGAILLAGEGVGLFEARATAQQWATYGPVTSPNPGNSELYQELLTIFRAAYQKHKDDFRRLSRLNI
jgi:xylulokinase